MEYLNVYDNNKNKLDKKIVRGDKLSNDEHILVAVIFIKNKDNKYLIQKTSLEKSGLYSTTGGHVLYNEDSKTSIIREVKEETGIDLENEVINNPFLKIIYLNKDYPSKGENRESDIYYYVVETNKLPDLENVNYTESEINKHFELIYIDLDDAINIIKENIPNHKDNKIISKDMIIALEEYERIK